MTRKNAENCRIMVRNLLKRSMQKLQEFSFYSNKPKHKLRKPYQSRAKFCGQTCSVTDPKALKLLISSSFDRTSTVDQTVTT